ncbi:hypothetical protein AKO1_015844 [Acrasis kona]|uniref:Uncharacterized protein n=1 Tax=Acrasis kona TaxID=1008807 RepID=A0AAW2ZGZ9_9EUKA
MKYFQKMGYTSSAKAFKNPKTSESIDATKYTGDLLRRMSSLSEFCGITKKEVPDKKKKKKTKTERTTAIHTTTAQKQPAGSSTPASSPKTSTFQPEVQIKKSKKEIDADIDLFSSLHRDGIDFSVDSYMNIEQPAHDEPTTTTLNKNVTATTSSASGMAALQKTINKKKVAKDPIEDRVTNMESFLKIKSTTNSDLLKRLKNLEDRIVDLEDKGVFEQTNHLSDKSEHKNNAYFNDDYGYIKQEGERLEDNTDVFKQELEEVASNENSLDSYASKVDILSFDSEMGYIDSFMSGEHSNHLGLADTPPSPARFSLPDVDFKFASDTTL